MLIKTNFLFVKQFYLLLLVAVTVVSAGSFVPVTHAASSPLLGTTSGFAVLAGSTITNTGSTTVTGDMGLSPGTAVTGFPPGVLSGVQQINNAVAVQAKSDLQTAYNNLASQSVSATVSTELGGTTKTTGVYNSADGTFGITGTLTLDGQGDPNAVFIFKTATTLVTAGASAINLINGAQACNVYWQVGSSATLGSLSNFKGSILAQTAVTLTTGAQVSGRIFAQTAAVTLDTNSVTVSNCAVVDAVVPVVGGGPANATITVVKQVINDGGDTAVYSDFQLMIQGENVDSGQARKFSPGTYQISEKPINQVFANRYTTTFGGDCDAQGRVVLGGSNKLCLIINNDKKVAATPIAQLVPPLINVTKIPDPLSLPGGAGIVNYDYAVTNIGTVAMKPVTISDDKCPSVTFIAGDTNGDGALNVGEIWKYNCASILQNTTTNTVTVTGTANGITAIDTASATVVVGVGVAAPIIHLVKTPSEFSVVMGSLVTYRYVVTNPGTSTIANVQVTDNLCKTMSAPVGDSNENKLLEVGEIWQYTCQMKISKLTTNTALARGMSNGYLVEDFAVATVAVTVPKLPNTGSRVTLGLLIAAAVGASALLGGVSYLLWKKRLG